MARKLIDSQFDERALTIYVMKSELGMMYKDIASYWSISPTRCRQIYAATIKNFHRDYYKAIGWRTVNNKKIKARFVVYGELATSVVENGVRQHKPNPRKKREILIDFTASRKEDKRHGRNQKRSCKERT